MKTISQWANYMTGGSLPNVAFLSAEENQELVNGLDRLKAVGRAASANQLRLLVDGEFTYINPAISIAALSMAGAFNTTRPVVWNTYQCYLRVSFISLIISKFTQNNRFFFRNVGCFRKSGTRIGCDAPVGGQLRCQDRSGSIS